MQGIRNLLLDFGGVLFEVDYSAPVRTFKEIGFPDFETQFSKLKQSRLIDDFEKGLITVEEFHQKICQAAGRALPGSEIDRAWNSILIGLPHKAVDLLKELRKQYRLLLLSNTNQLHEQKFRAMIREMHGSDLVEELFDRVYLSHHLHLRKPDRSIFDFVIRDAGILPDETLFIDDSPQHVEGALQTGLRSVWLEHPGKTRELLESLGLL